MGPISTIEPMEWANGRASLAPLSFDDLDGFRGDDHLAAFAAWRRSAHALLEGPPPTRPAIVPPPALIEVARTAFAHDVSSRRAAADFFVSHFRPYRVFPDGDGRLRPYPERSAIEAAAADGKMTAILWLENPVELFLAQVQGSAHVSLRDGRQVRLAYDGRNGQPYTSIGRLLIEAGAIAEKDMSLAALKGWLRANGQNPGQAGRNLMQRNRSYVFFKLEESFNPDEGPTGGAGVALTKLRSIAIDRALWPYGAPFWIDANLPWRDAAPSPFRRLMIAQDTGSAILGPARADIFFGSGEEAGLRAGAIRDEAIFVVLLPAGGAP